MNSLPLTPATGTPQRPPYGHKTVFLDRDGLLKVISGNTGLVTVLEESDGADPLAVTALQPGEAATPEQGAKADTALQDPAAFATAAQGSTADAALPKTGGTMTGNLTIGAGSNIVFTDTVWDDLRFPSSGINPTGAADAPARSTVTGMLEFSGTIDNVLTGTAQLPHAWLPGTVIRPHLHLWFPTSAASNTRWKLEVNRADGDTDFEAAYGSYTSGGLANGGIITIANPQNALREVLQGWGDLAMTNLKESAIVMWRITRLANSDATDNHTSAVVLLDVDFHFQLGKLGTDNELPA